MTDYMTQPKELAKQPDAKAVFEQIARYRHSPVEQQQVLDALWSFWNFAHAFDDLIDESGWPIEKKELAWKALQQFTQNLLVNPFIYNNAVSIEALLTSGIERQLAAEDLAKRGETEELLRAVRCADVDFIVHLARLAGGWEAMRAVGSRRDYDKADNAEPRMTALKEWAQREDHQYVRR